MERSFFSWRNLKTLSNCGFVLMVVVQILNWHNGNQFELVMNDPEAKALWIRTRDFYNLLGWISIAACVGFRLCYWVVEYIHDRRNLVVNRGH